MNGAAYPPQAHDREELMPRAEQGAPANAVVAEPEAEELARLRARVANLEAQSAQQAADRPVRTFVSGRYRSTEGEKLLELRVDVDGPRPMGRISGDFFQTSGATTNYVGSFVVEAPSVVSGDGVVKLAGRGKFSFPAVSPHVEVAVVVDPVAAPRPGPATVQFSNDGAAPSATYLCTFASPHFRTVQLEQDSVAGTIPFVSYNTGSLAQPPSSPARVLNVPAAYAEAGIQMQIAGTPDVISTGAAGPDLKWNDAELHNAMVNHFSLWRDAPLWQVWQLVATAYEDSTVRGIMFDFGGSFQRQGCAVFHNLIQGDDPVSRRAQLRTYVHELGHAFNLLHSWDKNSADPPQPLGPNGGLGDLSWMNYVQNYKPLPPAPGGAAAYWAEFPFQFTDSELVHVRHGFYRDVVMGGNPFGVGAAEVDADLFGDPVIDHSGLTLELRSKETFRLGEPVVVELKLATSDLRGCTTFSRLHPKDGYVNIAIRPPSGQVKAYRPALIRCADGDDQTVLDTARPAIYDSAYIGYGRDGLYFQQPGRYQLRAQYCAADGSRVISQVHQLTVRAPHSDEDENVADLMLGDEQGTLFYLLGSRSESLTSGNEALGQVLERYSDHPLAVYPRLVKGFNAARDFKDLTADKTLRIRCGNPDESISELNRVVNASTGDQGVDNITLGQVMRRLAHVAAEAGDPQRATQVMDRMVDVFRGKNLNPHVMREIETQAEQTKAAVTRP
ncbi:hypothetical protein ABZ471_27360 [Streptomyces sp. NPDC005728]|uniref:hypothetical protein n=1 Tax=Streptomyces sp. NPDC005728 TaxID=3157054 RepID=UPI0033CDC7CA